MSALSSARGAVAMLGQESRTLIVCLTPLQEAEGSTAAFWLGRDSHGTTRESTETDLVVRNVNEGSADSTGALSRLINPSDPTAKLKRVHLHFKEREKVCRMRRILNLVILGWVKEARTASSPVLQSHVQTMRPCFQKCSGSRGLHQEDNSNSGCT